jgi:hypothetical protein
MKIINWHFPQTSTHYCDLFWALYFKREVGIVIFSQKKERNLWENFKLSHKWNA